jgi:hypothetical protein
MVAEGCRMDIRCVKATDSIMATYRIEVPGKGLIDGSEFVGSDV